MRIALFRGSLIGSRVQTIRTAIEEEIRLDTEAMNRGAQTRNTTREIWWDSIVNKPVFLVDALPHRTNLEEMRRVLQHLEEIYASVRDPINDAEEASTFIQRLRGEAQDRPEPLKGALNRDADELESLLDAIAQFRTKLLPRSLGFIFVVLSWFAVAGVWWPLAALPNSAWMFLAFTVGLVALIGYFIWQFRELRELGRFRW